MEAKARRAALQTDVRRGEFRERPRIRFDDYAASWVETYQGRTSKQIEPSTRASYRRRLVEEAIPYFGGALLAEIEAQDVKAFVVHVAQRRRRGDRYAADLGPVSQNTVRLALAPVKALFATALEEGLIRSNPAAGVRIVVPRAIPDDEDEDDAGPVKALTAEQLAAVLDALPDEWVLLFEVLVALGLRIGELIELRWRDVDLGARTVRVRRKFYDGKVGPPKSKYGRRTLRLTPELARALWQLRKATRGGAGDLVFTAPRGGRLIPSNLMSRVLKPAAVKAGLGELAGDPPRAESWVGFHTFRHTCATLLFKAGWNPKQVQLWLGHHSPTFTVERYIHLLDEDLPSRLRSRVVLGAVLAARVRTRNAPPRPAPRFRRSCWKRRAGP
jgi:integrase